MSRTIDVTEEDIRTGKPGDCFRCAVALAANRAFAHQYQTPFTPSASVSEGVDGYSLNIDGRILPLPSEIGVFVQSFDSQDEGLEPISFKVPPFSEWFEECAKCGDEMRSDDLDGDGLCEDCHSAVRDD